MPGKPLEHRHVTCVSSVHMHAPLSHWTSLANDKFKDKMMKSDKIVTAEH